MSNVLTEVLHANAKYTQIFGEKANLPMPPGRQFAILTCMDARLDPAKYAGLAEGDAHVIRNAGGRASDDAIRSLVISNRLLGTREWFVIHHTDCGMETFTNETMRELLRSQVGDSESVQSEANIDWLTIEDQAESIREDVAKIREHPLTPADIEVYGYLFDVKSGELIEIPLTETTEAKTETAETTETSKTL
ncbi:carbonic anhydrase [Gemmatimonas aurantiaca]|nr:carbonic anhydrase [Gemmatimonas aurantiaca]